MLVLHNLLYRFSTIPIKIPASYFMVIDKLILMFIWRGKRPRIGKTVLQEENKVGGLTPPHLKTYYKATVIKTMCYWQKKRQIDQWNRIESPEIDPHKYIQVIFDKGAKAIHWNKDHAGTTGHPHEKRNLGTDHMALTKMNSKCIINLNIIHKTKIRR